jgi:hypothetical protein
MPPVRKSDNLLKNFTGSLTDNDLQFFASRLYYQYQDDLFQVFDHIDNMKKNGHLENIDVDHWFSGAKNSNDFYRQVDQLTNSCMKEYERRGGTKLNLV